MSMELKSEQINGTSMAMIGVGTYVDVANNILYWTDKALLSRVQLHRYDLATNAYAIAEVPNEGGISFIYPVEGTTDEFVVGGLKRLLLIRWDGYKLKAETLKVLAELPDGVRFNDAKIDSLGRLYVGSMIDCRYGDIFDYTKRIGCIFMYTMEEGLVVLKENVGFANGISFNEKLGIMYFVDSYDLNIKQYSWDKKTGKISDEKIFVDLTNHGTPMMTFPDGLTADTEDNLYLAMFGGKKILKINPKTKDIVTIPIPVEQVTSLAFGGEGMNSMFFNSSSLDNSDFMKGIKQVKVTFPNGFGFKIEDMGATGYEFYSFKAYK